MTERTVTEVPPGQVNFVIALLKADGLTEIEKTPTGNTFTIIGRTPGGSGGGPAPAGGGSTGNP